MKGLPGLTSIEEKCSSYSFINEIYGKNAYHRKFTQNLKMPRLKLSGHYKKKLR